MPEVFRFFGFSFFFYSKGHEPLHVHVEGNGGKAKFDLNQGTLISQKADSPDIGFDANIRAGRC